MVSANLRRLIVLSLVSWCIDAQPSGKPSDLSKKMMGLLNACFVEQLNSVVTTPDLYDIFFKTSWRNLRPPMILIDKNFVAHGAQQHYPQFATFVFAPYSVKSFNEMLMKVRVSPWWHKDALFFIIGNLKDGCKSAKKILKSSWKLNSVSALFLCHEEGRGAMLYTFNPYRNQAPYPWEGTKGSNQLNNHWTMYKQKYREGRRNCKSLMFNKVKFTDKQQTNSLDRSKSGDEETRNEASNFHHTRNTNSRATSEKILQSLLSMLNISAELNNDHLCYPDNEKKTVFIRQLINKLHDILVMAHDFVPNAISIYLVELLCSKFSEQLENICIISLGLFGLIFTIYKHLESGRTLLKSSSHLSCGGWDRSHVKIMKYIFFRFIQLIFVLCIIFQLNSLTLFIRTGCYHANDSIDLMNYKCGKNKFTFQRNNSDVLDQRIGYDNFGKFVGISATCRKTLQQMLIAKCKEQLIKSRLDLDMIPSNLCRNDSKLWEQIDSREIMSREAEYGKYSEETNFGEQYSQNMSMNKGFVQYRPIRLRDLTFVFIVLLSGMWLSMVIFIIETYSQLLTKMKIYVRKVIDFL